MSNISNHAFIAKIRSQLDLLNLYVPNFSILDHEITFTFEEILSFLKEHQRLVDKVQKFCPMEDNHHE